MQTHTNLFLAVGSEHGYHIITTLGMFFPIGAPGLGPRVSEGLPTSHTLKPTRAGTEMLFLTQVAQMGLFRKLVPVSGETGVSS